MAIPRASIPPTLRSVRHCRQGVRRGVGLAADRRPGCCPAGGGRRQQRGLDKLIAFAYPLDSALDVNRRRRVATPAGPPRTQVDAPDPRPNRPKFVATSRAQRTDFMIYFCLSGSQHGPLCAPFAWLFAEFGSMNRHGLPRTRIPSLAMLTPALKTRRCHGVDPDAGLSNWTSLTACRCSLRCVTNACLPMWGQADRGRRASPSNGAVVPESPDVRRSIRLCNPCCASARPSETEVGIRP